MNSHDEAALIARARSWAEEDPDAATRSELERLIETGDGDELRERFGSRLEFGTAGLRGLLGAGPNRMNRALVRRVTAGLAAYLLDQVPEARERGVVVGRDGRRLSPELAADTAGVLAAAGIPVHWFPDLVPTPLAAYAVTELGAVAGVMVTASHNPPAYNGYKVYWGNGAQIIPPHDTGISDAIDAAPPVPQIPVLMLDDAREAGRLHEIGPGLGESYVRRALELRRHPEVSANIGIAYTPLHGVGGAWVKTVLARGGFDRLAVVPEQAEPDGEFPTVDFPNPEEPGAMDLALALARRERCDLVLANDPDADRLAVSVADGSGGFRALTGNEIGIVLAYYLLTENAPDRDRVVITTLVSSSVLKAMAADFGVEYAETLTGFKWIANRALELRAERNVEFVVGFEEALGYSVGELVRDKDGVSAALLFAEIAAVCRSRDRTLLDYLEEVHRRFGVFASSQVSLTLPGAEGLREIKTLMERFRDDPPTSLAGVPVHTRSDLREGTRVDISSHQESALDFPTSNVLVYELADRSRILLRPSGTEPKIKFYFEVLEPVKGPYAQACRRAEDRLEHLRQEFQKQIDRRRSG